MKTKKEILSDLPSPDSFDKSEEPKVFSLLYKISYKILDVCLDIRSNTNPNKDKPVKKKIEKKPDNPVIPKNFEVK